MDPWIASIVPTVMLGFALWLGRKFIAIRLVKSVEHKFNEELEAVRAEFRNKEKELKASLQERQNEITDLRSGALTAMASRQMALDKRRLESVDQLWSSMIALSGARNISSLMAGVNFDIAAEEATRNPKVREAFTMMDSIFDHKKLNLSDAEKARPFVSPMVWALFSAYRAIAMQAVVKLQIIKAGIGADLLKKDAVSNLVKAALPHRTEFIDKNGDAVFHCLLEELEEALLSALHKMLAGEETDQVTLERANDIIGLSNDLMANQSKVRQSAL